MEFETPIPNEFVRAMKEDNRPFDERGRNRVGLTFGLTKWTYIFREMDLQNPVFDPLQNIGNRPKIGAKPRKSANRRQETAL
jgi:hypothetical protein